MWRWARWREGIGGGQSTAAAAQVNQPRPAGTPMFSALWETVSRIMVPVMLARGMLPQSVVGDEDEAELLKRLPAAEVIHFEHAGHSVQGDMPVELAREIDRFVFS